MIMEYEYWYHNAMLSQIVCTNMNVPVDGHVSMRNLTAVWFSIFFSN